MHRDLSGQAARQETEGEKAGAADAKANGDQRRVWVRGATGHDGHAALSRTRTLEHERQRVRKQLRTRRAKLQPQLQQRTLERLQWIRRVPYGAVQLLDVGPGRNGSRRTRRLHGKPGRKQGTRNEEKQRRQTKPGHAQKQNLMWISRICVDQKFVGQNRRPITRRHF